ncbi:hypothetical protein HU147_03520 [Planomicrobium chinense]|uniref:hypothetical protein n=1 Tax=Planococcus chinensis TaxID=272917 RepID=UPI001CC7D33E|nr:hypothetical protein [Planococcus chinensis]MBZ5200278.1 hypothetical protein [Planococcus chinensis]
MDLSWILVIAGAILAAVYLVYGMMDNRLKAMEKQLADMQKTIAAINSEEPLKEPPVNEGLRQLLQDGKDIEAIKMAREHLGLSLLEAKKYVDSLSGNT